MKRTIFVAVAASVVALGMCAGMFTDGLFLAATGTIQEKLIAEDHTDDSAFPDCRLRLRQNGFGDGTVSVPLKVFRQAAVGAVFRKQRWSLTYEIGEKRIHCYFWTVVLFTCYAALAAVIGAVLRRLRRKEKEGAEAQRGPLLRPTPLNFALVILALALGIGMLGFGGRLVYDAIRSSVRKAANEAAIMTPSNATPEK